MVISTIESAVFTTIMDPIIQQRIPILGMALTWLGQCLVMVQAILPHKEWPQQLLSISTNLNTTRQAN